MPLEPFPLIRATDGSLSATISAVESDLPRAVITCGDGGRAAPGIRGHRRLDRRFRSGFRSIRNRSRGGSGGRGRCGGHDHVVDLHRVGNGDHARLWLDPTRTRRCGRRSGLTSRSGCLLRIRLRRRRAGGGHGLIRRCRATEKLHRTPGTENRDQYQAESATHQNRNRQTDRLGLLWLHTLAASRRHDGWRRPDHRFRVPG